MSEFDELQRLRDADPVSRESIPSATDPGPRALEERIIMSDAGVSGIRSRARMLTAAAAAAVAIATGGIVLATRGPAAVTPESPGGGGMAMCAFLYDLETLADREFAFDGTVTAVDGDRATFTVNEWFTGGSGAEVTLDGASAFGSLSSVGDDLVLEPGVRALVAGDDTFAWACGFTQAYDAGIAEAWRAALG